MRERSSRGRGEPLLPGTTDRLDGGSTRRLVPLCNALLVLLAATPFTAAREIVPGFYQSTVASGLTSPTAIAFLPDGRVLVTERAGRLSLLSGGSVTPLITIPSVDCPAGEMGLLGVAVDPGFDSNGYIYLYHTKLGSLSCELEEGRINRIVRVTMGPGGSIEEGSLTEIISGIRALSGSHNGGGLLVGPDGKLYLGVGDDGVGDTGGAPGSSTNPFAQDLGVLEGKILRLNLDGTPPADNPYAGQPGKRGEIFASGLRNPWRFTFDPKTGKLWVGDVGEETIEEIDVVERGRNYGWPRCEGPRPDGCALPGDVQPVLAYTHDGSYSLGRCVIGGAFGSETFGPYSGDYFFGDLVAGRIYRVRLNAARTGVIGPVSVFLTGADGPVDIQFGPDGALYYVAYLGEIRKVVPARTGEHPISGRRLHLNGGRQKALRAVSKDPIQVEIAIDDPVVIGGSLRVVGTGIDETYPLPAEKWRVVGDMFYFAGFEYFDLHRREGPITHVRLLNGHRLRIAGRGPGLGLEIGPSDPTPVELILTAGGKRFCMSFGGEAERVAPHEFVARNAPPPAHCRDQP